MSQTNLELRFINLDMYDSIINRQHIKQAMHNEIVAFNGEFERNLGTHKNFIEITGCTTPIYVVMIDKQITFVCKSKILRSYIFCMLINYIFDSKFNFTTFLAKYHVEDFLTSESRIESLRNLLELISKIPKRELKYNLLMKEHTFIRSKECLCDHCGCHGDLEE